MEDHLDQVGRLRIVHRLRPAQFAIGAVRPGTVPAVAARAGTLEDPQPHGVRTRFRPRRRKRRGGGHQRRVGVDLRPRRAGLGRNGLQIHRHRPQVLRRQPAETQAHRLAHRSGCSPAARRVPGRQVARDLLHRPVADPRLGIAGQVIRLPALGRRTRELLPALQAEQQVAWRVALGAVAGPLHKIGAAVPFGRLVRVPLERLLRHEQQLPRPHQIALVEREGELVDRHRLVHRPQRVEIRADREHVVGAHVGVGGVGKRRIQLLPVVPHAVPYRAHELGIAPRADAVLGIGRDVGRIDRPERQLERQATRIGLAIGRRVAGDAVRRGRKIAPLLHQRPAGRLGGARRHRLQLGGPREERDRRHQQ